MARKFHRKKNQRKALLKGLTVSLILRGRIKTTLARAKEMRSLAERLVTYAKKKTEMMAFRDITKFIDKVSAKKLIKNIAPKYISREGGYTRIIKLGQRGGDAAKTVFIEWV